MRENYKTAAIKAILVAVLAAALIVANSCGPDAEEARMQVGELEVIEKTSITVLHDQTRMERSAFSTFPITITCELRPGGSASGSVIMQQAFTRTVPCMEEFSEAPATDPISLTWRVGSLPLGWYEEWCKVEALEAEGWYMVSHWESGYNCYLPIILEGAQ